MNEPFDFAKVFYIVMACVSPCIWGLAVTILYPYRRLTSTSWLVALACGMLFLTSGVSACAMVAQMSGEGLLRDNPMLIANLYQAINVVYKLAAAMLVIGVWRSFRDLRSRLDLLSDVVEQHGGEVLDGDFRSGF